MLLISAEDSRELPACALALGRRAFHEPLEVDRRVLAAEQHTALPYSFVTTERRVLTDLVEGVRGPEERALVQERLRRLAIPREPGIDRRDL